MPPVYSETIRTFLAAAQARFDEGTALLNAGHSGGAVYLFGYVAEIVLKAAAFRNYGHGLDELIRKEDRDALEVLMKPWLSGLVPKGPHDIVKWAKWIVVSNSLLATTPFPIDFGREIERHANVIDAQWSPSMRYQGVAIPFLDVLTVQSSSRWFLSEESKM